MTDYLANVTESLTFSDSAGKGYTKTLPESLQMSDVLASREFIATRTENVSLVETVTRLGAYLRDAAESLTMEDVRAAVDALVVRSYRLRFTDLFLGPANGVMNYLTVLSKGSREDDMLKLFDHGPLGYGRFRRFYPGALRFRNLLVKTVLSTRDKSTRPRIVALNTTIDVPDKRIQGSASIVSGEYPAGKTVAFGQKFYSLPEVLPLWKSGTTPARAVLVATTLEDFTFQLVSLADGVTLVEGTITYAVLGY